MCLSNRRIGISSRTSIPISGHGDDVPCPGLHGPVEYGYERLARVRIEGRWLQEDAVGPLDRGIERRRLSVVQLDDLHTRFEKVRGPLGTASARLHLGAGLHQKPNQLAADGTRRPGHEDSLVHGPDDSDWRPMSQTAPLALGLSSVPTTVASAYQRRKTAKSGQ